MRESLEMSFRQVKGAASLAGLDTSDWTLQSGSRTNGVSFTLMTPKRHIKLGRTSAEAERTLDGMAQAFWLLRG